MQAAPVSKVEARLEKNDRQRDSGERGAHDAEILRGCSQWVTGPATRPMPMSHKVSGTRNRWKANWKRWARKTSPPNAINMAGTLRFSALPMEWFSDADEFFYSSQNAPILKNDCRRRDRNSQVAEATSRRTTLCPSSTNAAQALL